MLNPLGLLNSGLGNDFERIELALMNNQIDWPKFTIADFDARVVIKKLFLRWLLALIVVCSSDLFSLQLRGIAVLLARTHRRPSCHQLFELLASTLAP